MIHIPHGEIRFHPHSFADPSGRLFWWNGQLFRGLRPHWATLFKRLYRAGTLQRLVEQGLLIDTEPTDFCVDDYEMVVRHRTVPFASYPEEWCPMMLKDAALTLLDLLSELARCGLTLKDAHPWNLLFDRGRPVYVDITSIVPISQDGWSGHPEFYRFYRNPLLLMAHGQERIARRLLPEYDGVTEADVAALTCSSTLPRSVAAAIVRHFKGALRKSRAGRAKPVGGKQDPGRALIRLISKTRSEIQSIHLPEEDFVNRTDDFSNSVFPRDESQNHQRVREILAQINPKSVLDIEGFADGRYATVAAIHGSAALAMSTKSAILTKLYAVARQKRLPLLPLAMDFADPTPARGIGGHWAIAASERLKCEMVLALSNIHRYVLQRSLNFDQIADGLASFSKRWLIAELIPADTNHVTCPGLNALPGSMIDDFISALRSRFRDVSIVSGHRGTSIVVLAEK